jgi:hypothetical protein
MVDRMKHTHTPWKTVGETLVYGQDNYCIAATMSDHWVSNRDIDESLANAQHIVRCVNSHDDLVDALQRAVFLMHNQGDIGTDEWIETEKKALAALKKATE